MVIRGGLVGGGASLPEASDVRLSGGLVVSMAPRLPVGPGDEVLDASGGLVLPGLHDHHIHLRAVAAARRSVPVGPPEVRNRHQLALQLAAADARAAPGAWLRGVGYHPSVAGDLDRWALDEMCAGRPVRLQHAGGALWIVNSLGAELLALHGPTPPGFERDGRGAPTGRIWREDRWLAQLVPADPAADARELAAFSRQMAAQGVTGFTDATPGQADLDVEAWQQAVDDGTVVQRVHLMAEPGTGRPDHPLVTLGPVKVLLDDTNLPRLDQLVALVTAAHRRGRPVAVHCVTRVQGALATAAVEEAGARAGDRLEHGAVLGRDLLARLARLGITVVTQPGMLAARGDRYLAEVDAEDLHDLWRLRSLVASGVPVAAGSDAPYGPADPWATVIGAIRRQSPLGRTVGPGEIVSGPVALGLLTGRADHPARQRRIRPGEPADLCIVATEALPDGLGLNLAGDADPGIASGARPAQPPDLSMGLVTAVTTIVAGRIVHHR